jgi:DNA end-binding protein Ku
MALRASWKGHLKLLQITCPVALYAASSASDKISFHILNRATGNRVRQQLYDESTGEEVAREDQVKGYEVEKNRFVQVEAAELDALRPENRHVIEVAQFVDPEALGVARFDGAHYLAPADRAGFETFALLREAMVRNKVAAVATTVLSTRERLLLIQPRGDGMLARTLRWPHELRSERELFDGIPQIELSDEMLDIAKLIVRRKQGAFAPEEFHDRYEEAVAELIRAKAEGRAPAARAVPAPAPVVNLLEALKASMAAEGGAERRRPAAASKPAGRSKAEPAPEAAPAGRRRQRA